MNKFFKIKIDKVVKNGNCSGCGACTQLTNGLAMKLDNSGYMRPFEVLNTSDDSPDSGRTHFFDNVCPGVKVVAPPVPEGGAIHSIFGAYISAWESWAVNEKIRKAGSSGGVLTALTAWLLDSNQADTVIGSASDKKKPYLTKSVILNKSNDVIEAAGSRYAPVANMEKYNKLNYKSAMIGKPCEITAAYQLNNNILHQNDEERPLLMSFFCAGTPSQHATNSLAESLGFALDRIKKLRYRGNGWPGNFEIEDIDGNIRKISYDDSWGKHLGRSLQWRCKICIDGVGGHADISVGDFWKANEQGYPMFDDDDGKSVVIARTWRGHQLLQRALEQGVIQLNSVDLDDVAKIQPLQVDRRKTMLGRLLARNLALKSTPRYLGYSLLWHAIRAPKKTLRSAAGTFLRSVR